jgi:hypothetical protein
VVPIDDQRMELARLWRNARNLFTRGEHDAARELGKLAEELLEDVLESRRPARITLKRNGSPGPAVRETLPRAGHAP